MSLRIVFVSALLGLALLAVTASTAHAQARIGVEVEYAVPTEGWIDEPNDGVGLHLRVGYDFPLSIVVLTPEILFQYNHFANSSEGAATYNVLRGAGGLRLGLALIVEPRIFIHVGYGDLQGEGSDFVIQEQGLTLDTGAQVSYGVQPYLEVGAQVGYHMLFHDEVSNTALPDRTDWVSFGVHVDVVF